MSTEQHVKHLWDCALLLDGDTHSKKLLKSYLINECREIAGTKDSTPLERFANSQMCERCALHWQENDFQMKLRPQTMSIRTNKARRLINKLKAQEGNKEQRLLTKKQKKRAKWLLKKAQSKVELKCGFCEHKTLVPLNKSNKRKSENKTIEKDVETTAIVALSKTKKKKKNKDTTAGLKIPKAKKVEIQEKLQAKKMNSAKNNSVSKVSLIPVKNIQIQNTKATKSKLKNSNKKEAAKIQSKTQKQNSLLHIAALLKSKDQSKALGNSSVKNRLESFLQ